MHTVKNKVNLTWTLPSKAACGREFWNEPGRKGGVGWEEVSRNSVSKSMDANGIVRISLGTS